MDGRKGRLGRRVRVGGSDRKGATPLRGPHPDSARAARRGRSGSLRLGLVATLVAVGGSIAMVAGVGSASASPSVGLVSASQWGPDTLGNMYAVGEVVNSGPGVASSVEVDLGFYSSANVLLGSDVTFASVEDLNPGETSPFEDIFAPPAGYSHYAVTGIYPSPTAGAPNHNFTTTVTNQTVNSFGDTDIVGTVRNNNTTAAAFVDPVFTFFNASGTAVATDAVYVNTDADSDLAPGQTATFEEIVNTSDPAFPAWTTYTIVTQSISAPSLPLSWPFQQLPGGGIAIGVGASGTRWIVGTNPAPGGDGIYHWAGTGWAAVAGGADTIAVGPDDSPWVTNSADQIYHRVGSAWVAYPGAATAIGVGANGSVWVIGTNTEPGGRGIYHWAGTGWAAVTGGAVTIAVGPDGTPWVTNTSHQIYHWTGAGWTLYPGAATAIGVGANGSVWAVGTNTQPGGYGIYQRVGSGWTEVAGGAVTLGVAANGHPWVINSAHQIFSS